MSVRRKLESTSDVLWSSTGWWIFGILWAIAALIFAVASTGLSIGHRSDIPAFIVGGLVYSGLIATAIFLVISLVLFLASKLFRR